MCLSEPTQFGDRPLLMNVATYWPSGGKVEWMDVLATRCTAWTWAESLASGVAEGQKPQIYGQHSEHGNVLTLGLWHVSNDLPTLHRDHGLGFLPINHAVDRFFEIGRPMEVCVTEALHRLQQCNLWAIRLDHAWYRQGPILPRHTNLLGRISLFDFFKRSFVSFRNLWVVFFRLSAQCMCGSSKSVSKPTRHWALATTVTLYRRSLPRHATAWLLPSAMQASQLTSVHSLGIVSSLGSWYIQKS